MFAEKDRPVAILFRRFGPYHHARLRAVAARSPVLGVETLRKDATYQWDVVERCEGFRRVRLFPDGNAAPPPAIVARRVGESLDNEKPRAIAIPGWSSPEALGALRWASERGVPTVLMCASQAGDYRRWSFKEAPKRKVVALCGASLVGGRRQQSYVAQLGMARSRIFAGYNVIDNDHFWRGADAARRDAGLRRRLGLPARYFLTTCRLVREKNISGLLEAYSCYRRRAGHSSWDLVLLGDGPLRTEVESSTKALDIQNAVLLAGFRQYHELPPYYAFAGAFVLPSIKDTWGLVVNEAMAAGLPALVSNRCGCAPELVEERRNGFTFDPNDTEALANLMLAMSTLSEETRLAMGTASREIIARWTPETFATNLMKAVEAATARPARKATTLDRALIWALAHRPGANA